MARPTARRRPPLTKPKPMLPDDPTANPRPFVSRRAFLVTTGAGLLTAGVALPFILSACSTGGRSTTIRTPRPLDPVPEPIWRPSIPTSEPLIRVRVAALRGSDNRAELGKAGDWLRVREIGSLRRGVVVRGPLRVTIDRSGWVIDDAGGLRLTLDPNAEVELGPPDSIDQPDPRFLIHAKDGAFPNRLRLVRRTDERGEGIDIVNDIPMETYLPGVLAKELYRHWHPETFAAQAVAARSFACVEHAHWTGKRHFDLHNTQASQAYIGATNHDRSLDAAKRTRGLLLAFGGFVVPGYYSSCCGGASADAPEAIGPNPVNNVPPLLARAAGDVCHTAPVYAWSVTRSTSDVLARLRNLGTEKKLPALAGASSVRAIEASSWNAAGRVTRYRVITDSRDGIELDAGPLQRALNAEAGGMSDGARSLRSSNFTARVDGSSIRFEGRGFGHGVGLCQYGAEARAKRGDGHTAILNHYYPGAELVRAYI